MRRELRDGMIYHPQSEARGTKAQRGQGLVQNQDQGRATLWSDPGATVLFPAPSYLPPIGPQS